MFYLARPITRLFPAAFLEYHRPRERASLRQNLHRQEDWEEEKLAIAAASRPGHGATACALVSLPTNEGRKLVLKRQARLTTSNPPSLPPTPSNASLRDRGRLCHQCRARPVHIPAIWQLVFKAIPVVPLFQVELVLRNREQSLPTLGLLWRPFRTLLVQGHEITSYTHCQSTSDTPETRIFLLYSHCSCCIQSDFCQK